MALILASSSAIRSQMLAAAGVEFETAKPDVDEEAVKARYQHPEELTVALAEAKALSVNSASSRDWLIGSDSVVSVDGRRFDKPPGREQASEHLRAFSGKTMQLTSAVALAHDGAADWRHVEAATLQVRPLSEQFIESYLEAEWPDVGYCVGVFRLEGRGVQLFERIDGDYFTILGMPLLPLLDALRERRLLLA